MDSVHDMGGMHGFGKVEVEKNERYSRHRRMRFAQEQLPPITYLSASYYQRWVLGMEKKRSRRCSTNDDGPNSDIAKAISPRPPSRWSP
jgi:hypothetical protein